jgi:FtsP/CotA-like multicopper oxidase with cupredoxin domain
MNAGRGPSRKAIKRLGLLLVAGTLAITASCSRAAKGNAGPESPHADAMDGARAVPDSPEEPGPAIHRAFMPGYPGRLDPAAIGFDPSAILKDFDYGKVARLPGGGTLREYWIRAEVKTVEVAPGLFYEAWTYNGRVPGPTIRAVEGDFLRIHFTNATPHPHTMHFHGIHPANMDGVFEPVPTGESFTYEFEALPVGVHPYHCHIMPLASHISRGLYGTFIVDPKGGRPPVDSEMVMVMSGIDLDFDNANDLYAVNFIPFYYDLNPIRIKVGEKIRVYLVNMTEFDPVNSFHLHANFFDYYPTGTSLSPAEYTDTIAQVQAQRGILEFSYSYPGKYMFHAHKTEFAELGWTGIFQVEE